MKRYLIFVALLGILEIGLVLYLSFWREIFWNFVSAKNVTGFTHYLIIFTGVALTYCVTTASSSYFASKAAIKWREKLNARAYEMYTKEVVLLDARSIPNFPNYYITSNGEIYSDHRSKFRKLNPTINVLGYYQIQLCLNNRRFNKLVHRLVAETFLPKKDKEFNTINHINGIKTDNNVKNLKWCSTCIDNQDSDITGLNTPKYIKNSRVKLKDADVINIRKSYPKLSMTELKILYNVSYATINLIINNKTWKHLL